MRSVLVLILVCAWATPAWAKTMKIPKGTINVSQLQEELLVRFPQWRGAPQPDGSFSDPLLRLEYNEQEIRLDIPDQADDAAVQAVVRAHVPGPRKAKGRAKSSSTTTMQERMDRVEQTLGLD